MIRCVIVLAGLLGATCALCAADEKDPVKENLLAAKVTYDKEMSAYRKAASEWFDKRENAARNAGDKKAVDAVKAERKAFDEDGVLPKTAPASVVQKPAAALKVMEAAYTDAVKAYTKAKKDDLAAAVEKELADIKAKGGFPSIAGVWRDGPKESKVLVTITQKAEHFVADATYQHPEHGEIRWRMTGTVSRDGTIKGMLVHTKSPPNWESQARTGKLKNGDTITGTAEFKGGSHDFVWTLVTRPKP